MATKATLPSRLHHTAYVSRTSRRRASSTRRSSGCRCWRPGARRTCCSAPSAPMPLLLRPRRRRRAGVLPVRRPGRPGAVRPEDAVLAVPPHRAATSMRRRRHGIEKRLKDAGYQEPQSFVLEHGYCRSVYVTDPNGMIVEFTLDHPDVEKINRRRARHARTPSSSAGWRAITPRTTRIVDAHQHRSHPHHARRQPASLAGGHRRVVRARAQRRSPMRPRPRKVIADAIEEVVKQQVAAGVDVVSDGEMSKISYATYIADRFTGFDGDTPREPGQDLVEFPRLLEKLAKLGSTAKYRRPRCVGEIRNKTLEPLQEDLRELRARRRRRQAGGCIPQCRLARRDRAVPAQRFLQDGRRLPRGRGRGAARRIRGHRRGRIPGADRCAGPRHGPAHHVSQRHASPNTWRAPRGTSRCSTTRCAMCRRRACACIAAGATTKGRITTTCRCATCCRCCSRPSRRRCCSRPPIRATRTSGRCSATRSCRTTRS